MKSITHLKKGPTMMIGCNDIGMDLKFWSKELVVMTMFDLCSAIRENIWLEITKIDKNFIVKRN